ncbi:MAG: MTH1187 family thiamine-binding protein [Thermodesulfobacteriota bacterium]|nr:MTH1187 family thiamine-binding protein [Thermodesulfobacteriota bacterium]
MAVVQISCTPLGEGSGGISKFVAGCLQLVEESGLKYQLTPMGTILEGELDDIFALVRKMHESPFNAGAQRVSTLIKIDDRRDREHTMEGKIRSVQQRLDKD